MASSPGQLTQPAAAPDDGRLDPAIRGQLTQRRAVDGGGRVDRAIAELAGRQQGNVSRWQLRALGLSAGAVDHRVATGRLHPHFRGVYLVGHTAEARYAREYGATLACGRGAVVSHRTALEVFDLVEPRGGPVDVSILSRSRRRHPGIRLHRQPSLRPEDVGATHAGLPVPSPARALLDFATQATPRELERAFHEALVQRLASRKQVEEAMRRAPGHRGIALLRPLVDDYEGPTLTRRDGEERMLALCRSARLVRPEVNARVHGFEVDFAWREPRVAVEVDSGRWHGNPAALERDHRKNLILRSHGWTVLRYTWRQIVHDRDAVVAEIATAIAAPPR